MQRHVRRPARSAALAAAALLLLAAAPAAAGEVLQLSDGDLIPGSVLAVDDAGVTFERESGGQLRVEWARVVPANRYTLWESTLAADDAAGRVELARWCASAGLFRYARRELVRAEGLGYAGPEDLAALLSSVEQADADALLAEVDALLEAGEPEEARRRITVWLRAARPGPHADRVRARIVDVGERIDRKAELEREEEQERVAAERSGQAERWVADRLADAERLRAAAGESAVVGYMNLARGNQTRARTALESSEQDFSKARKLYLRVRKAVGTGETAELAAERAKDCDLRTVEVLVRWGRMEVGNKNWRRASAIVDRGLRIDPVQRELLELRREIDENWIRRRFSGITNAEGRESGY